MSGRRCARWFVFKKLLENKDLNVIAFEPMKKTFIELKKIEKIIKKDLNVLILVCQIRLEEQKYFIQILYRNCLQ